MVNYAVLKVNPNLSKDELISLALLNENIKGILRV